MELSRRAVDDARCNLQFADVRRSVNTLARGWRHGDGRRLTECQIPSLARAEPDLAYLEGSREGFEHLGLTLEGPHPRR